MSSPYLRRCRCKGGPVVGPIYGLMDPWALLGYFVYCRKCHKETPKFKTSEEAQEFWNRGRKEGRI